MLAIAIDNLSKNDVPSIGVTAIHYELTQLQVAIPEK
jgi:hypothetical protein